MRGANSGLGTSVRNEELLAGVYDPNQRRHEVLTRLQASFTTIRETDLRSDSSENYYGSSWLGGFGGRSRGRKLSQPEDVMVMGLRALEDQISKLENDVEKYVGPHFTKMYRTHQGLCAKLQTDLDKLDVTGREDIRRDRKEAIMLIDKLAKKLASKAHPNGRSCEECEVQN